ncbi:hypothetical protein Tco_0188978, partial [Tanacetum coccineum]
DDDVPTVVTDIWLPDIAAKGGYDLALCYGGWYIPTVPRADKGTHNTGTGSSVLVMTRLAAAAASASCFIRDPCAVGFRNWAAVYWYSSYGLVGILSKIAGNTSVLSGGGVRLVVVLLLGREIPTSTEGGQEMEGRRKEGGCLKRGALRGALPYLEEKKKSDVLPALKKLRGQITLGPCFQAVGGGVKTLAGVLNILGWQIWPEGAWSFPSWGVEGSCMTLFRRLLPWGPLLKAKRCIDYDQTDTGVIVRGSAGQSGLGHSGEGSCAKHELVLMEKSSGASGREGGREKRGGLSACPFCDLKFHHCPREIERRSLWKNREESAFFNRRERGNCQRSKIMLSEISLICHTPRRGPGRNSVPEGCDVIIIPEHKAQ